MDFSRSNEIIAYLRINEDLFTLTDFYKYIRSRGVKITKAEALEVLRSSEYVFPLVNEEYITRAGVFTGRWFSFKPSKEEIEKGYIIIGHRTMPFTNPEISPDNIKITTTGKDYIDSESVTFSMNLALDTFALFGEGYSIPYIYNDKANETYTLASVQYSVPTEITLTAWPLKKITGGEKITYGDRILCRVADWETSTVEMRLLKSNFKSHVVSEEAIEREEWYSKFEEKMLQSIERHGPSKSIDEQLSLLILENQEELCTRNCGSIEEFFAHSTKLGFESYGVETRIWRKNEEIPLYGKWNAFISPVDFILSEIAFTLSPNVIDAYLENNIYEETKTGKTKDLEDLITELFPQLLDMTESERKLVLLNIEKRNGILREKYNRFSDYLVAETRKRILDLFTKVNSLFFNIGSSGIDVDEFPQHELIILSQLFGHIVNMLEEIEIKVLRESFPVNDVELSLNGMEETFEEIQGALKSVLKTNKYKGFEIVKKD